MSEIVRRWCPADWLDEVNPELQAAPDVFAAFVDGRWQLLPPNEDDRENEFHRKDLEAGQIVEFAYFEDYGAHDVTVDENGSWSCQTNWADTANCFWLPWDSDTLSDSMDELVRGATSGEPLEPDNHVVGVYYWSDSIPFRFEIEDGRGTFVPCGGAN